MTDDFVTYSVQIIGTLMVSLTYLNLAILVKFTSMKIPSQMKLPNHIGGYLVISPIIIIAAYNWAFSDHAVELKNHTLIGSAALVLLY